MTVSPLLRPLLLVLATTFLACSSAQEGTEAPEQEALPGVLSASLVDATFQGAWSGTCTREGAAPTTVSLELTRSLEPRSTKCGTHYLSTSVSTKCIDETLVNFTATLSSSDGAYNRAVLNGTMRIPGTYLMGSSLDLPYGNGERLYLAYRQGRTLTGDILLASGAASCTLVREAP